MKFWFIFRAIFREKEHMFSGNYRQLDTRLMLLLGYVEMIFYLMKFIYTNFHNAILL